MTENNSSWIVIRRLRLPILIIIVTFAISIVGMVLIPGQDDQGHTYHLTLFDAFYFVSYMASTIGFGESPYSFTYSQKLWVSFVIYLTVIGWFYGIGTIVALIQDEVLHREMIKSRFARAVRRMNEPFILIFGYNSITRALIEKLSRMEIRMVVIDKDQKAIDALMLRNYYPLIPAFSGDVFDPKMLELAGIRKKTCKSAVILFEDEQKNTRVSLMCKHMNKRMKLIVRSTSPQNSEFLETIGVEHIENPFEVISRRLHLALTAPNLWLLEMWIYGHLLKIKEREVLPRGEYIIYGYGRMGRALEKGLKKAGIIYRFVDAKLSLREHDASDSLYHEDEIEEKLLAAGIDKAAVVIAATRDDMINLAVITLARKHNPSIYTISRENELIDLQIFKAARINRNYILDEIIIHKTYNYLTMPLVNVFIEYLNRRDEAWGERLVKRIVAKMGENPNLCEIRIEGDEAYAAVHELANGSVITLEMLGRRREDFRVKNDLLFLMVLRDEHPILLPPDTFEIAVGDELLVICLEESRIDLEFILSNYYELHYAMYGREKVTGVARYFIG